MSTPPVRSLLWVSFADLPAADDDFLVERPTIVAPRPVFAEPDEHASQRRSGA
ncbi:MAG: hypothetical protein FWF02_05100 [Micrococcales bacterium]|nr:hypothetical protein [Micrococcales bacterium]MCL2667070.1 hypothetical protein [Micrococcales bacterium]